MAWRAIVVTVSLMTVSCFLAALPIAKAEKPLNADVIRVEIQGRLKHGIVAIGGETTGTTITASGATLELDLQGKKEFITFAEKYSGKTVVAAGTLKVRPGVEVPQRWIVTVTRLEEVAKN